MVFPAKTKHYVNTKFNHDPNPNPNPNSLFLKFLLLHAIFTFQQTLLFRQARATA